MSVQMKPVHTTELILNEFVCFCANINRSLLLHACTVSSFFGHLFKNELQIIAHIPP
jgi:hypothetical protein